MVLIVYIFERINGPQAFVFRLIQLKVMPSSVQCYKIINKIRTATFAIIIINVALKMYNKFSSSLAKWQLRSLRIS